MISSCFPSSAVLAMTRKCLCISSWDIPSETLIVINVLSLMVTQQLCSTSNSPIRGYHKASCRPRLLGSVAGQCLFLSCPSEHYPLQLRHRQIRQRPPCPLSLLFRERFRESRWSNERLQTPGSPHFHNRRIPLLRFPCPKWHQRLM